MSLVDTITILVCLSALFSYVNHRFLKLPATIGLMALGLSVSLVMVTLGTLGVPVHRPAIAFMEHIDFNDTLMHGLLSFLLFAGALHFNIRDLLGQKWFIGTLASVGVGLSTCLVGISTYYAFRSVGLEIPILYCLLFGALISPTDPIAVLGILKEAGAPKSLETKIVGESLFNDGVGVVVFLVLLGIATRGMTSPADIGVLFLQEAGGGALLGTVLGFLTASMMGTIDDYRVEILLTLALVMGGYALADAWHMSGPIAVVVAGLVIGSHAGRSAMSDTTRQYLDTFWELVDELLNAVLFVLIGLEVLALTFEGRYLAAGLIGIPIVLAARLISIALPLYLFRLWRTFSPHAATILTWGGLRGGISVAMALSLPSGGIRDAIVAVTYVIVAFSILVQGLTIERLIRATTAGKDPAAAPQPPFTARG